MDYPLAEKNILVTGATSGIGFQAALDLARRGAFVIGAGRDVNRCKAAQQRILHEYPQARVAYLVADLSSQKEVKRLADEASKLIQSSPRKCLDVLVNNAGLFSDRKRLTEDGIELTFAVNHLAPFLLTHQLLTVLNASENAKVITVSSKSHYGTWFNPCQAANPPLYIIFWAYKVSKLSNVLFTAEFNRRNPNQEMCAYAVDPGLVNTEIGLKGTSHLVQFGWGVRKKQGTDADLPSQTILNLATRPVEKDRPSIYWKNSQPLSPGRSALNPDLARRLWEESCRLCGIKDYFLK